MTESPATEPGTENHREVPRIFVWIREASVESTGSQTLLQATSDLWGAAEFDGVETNIEIGPPFVSPWSIQGHQVP